MSDENRTADITNRPEDNRSNSPEDANTSNDRNLQQPTSLESKIDILTQQLTVLAERMTQISAESQLLRNQVLLIDSRTSSSSILAPTASGNSLNSPISAPSAITNQNNPPLVSPTPTTSHLSNMYPRSPITPFSLPFRNSELTLNVNTTNGNNIPTPANSNDAMNGPTLQEWLSSHSYHNLPSSSTSTTNWSQQKLYELPEFTGNPEDWLLFYHTFLETTKDFKYSNVQNALRLNKSIKGEARVVVRSLLSNPNNVPQVIETLESSYGRPELLLQSQIDLVKTIEPLEKTHEIVGFSIKVSNFTNFLKNMKDSMFYLCNTTLVKDLADKLPLEKRTSWLKHVMNVGEYPSMLLFSNWLEEEAKMINLALIPSDTKDKRIHVIDQQQSSKETSKSDEFVTKEYKRSCPVCKGTDHNIYSCKEFKRKSINERWDLVKKLKLCFSCLKSGHSISTCEIKKECGIRQCKRIHSKFLHTDERIDEQSNNENATTTTNNSSILNCDIGSKLLFKILPIRIYGPNKYLETYAFIDEGSNTSLVDMDLINNLGINPSISKSFDVKWFNGDVTSEKGYEVKIQIGPINNGNRFEISQINAVKNLDLPSQSINSNTLPSQYRNMDCLSLSYTNVKPKIMLGLNHCDLIFPQSSSQIGDLCLIQCKLGCIIYGKQNITNDVENHILMMNVTSEDDKLENIVRRYINNDGLEIESNFEQNYTSNSNAEQLLQKTTTKLIGEDRYQTGLLWSENNIKLPNNYDMALKRLQSIEKKMKIDPEYAKKYEENLMQYVEKGYARRLQDNEIERSTGRIWYLPHFAVFNPNKPNKFRIVFDAAAKFKNTSLNSCLEKGPDLNQPMMKLIQKFRIGSVAVCGDIREMFPQVKIIPEDQDAQRFIWRHGDCNKPIEHFVMTSMTFGAACSPTSAQFVKNLNASRFMESNPKAAMAILENHYVDDFIMTFDDVEEAEQITKEVIQIHSKAGFELRSFISNSEEVLLGIGAQNSESKIIEKVLGLFWDVKKDTIKFIIRFERFPIEVLNEEVKPTKRQVLKIVMSIFDPFGLLNNFTVHGRLLIQELWEHKLDWDSEVPDNLYQRWIDFKRGMKSIDSIEIPRSICKYSDSCGSLQIHIFTDASDKVYSAVAYMRVDKGETIVISIIASKVRIKSLKKVVSIPRMELQGAVLGIKLLKIILESYNFLTKNDVIFWCDSQIVLHWLNSNASNFKPYVSHRIQTIIESSPLKAWRYVPSNLNVADDATKRKKALGVSNTSRWINGPEFLKLDESHWPENMRTKSLNVGLEEERKIVNLITEDPLENFIKVSKFSSYRKLRRVVAWVIYAKDLFCHRNQINEPILSYENLKKAEIFLLKSVQLYCFGNEINCLRNQLPISKSSSLRKGCPYLDNDGILRISGRLEHAWFISFNSRHPIILPKKHILTYMIIRQYHEDFLHQNKHIVLNKIRMKYWIPAVKQQLSKIISTCMNCRVQRAMPVQPKMSSLPKERITPFLRPFTYCGLDYCGPFTVKNKKNIEKYWIMIFTCMSTRAIHLEVSEDLKSSSCLLALSNFMNRRGTPRKLRSDNASYFKCAKKRLCQIIDKEDMLHIMTKYELEWVFNTPESPHMGGAWERLIRCVKDILEVTLNQQKNLNKQIFHSLVIQAENMVNCRPLTDLPLEDEFSESLTPNHFLIGEQNSYQSFIETQNNIQDIVEAKIKQDLPKQFRIMKQIQHSLWLKWIKQYLPDLTKRSKWFDNVKSIALNDLVLICDSKTKYHQWERGRVVKLYPSKDSIVRSVDVKTMRGILRRPVNRLAILDVGLENVPE